LKEKESSGKGNTHSEIDIDKAICIAIGKDGGAKMDSNMHGTAPLGFLDQEPENWRIIDRGRLGRHRSPALRQIQRQGDREELEEDM